MRLKKAGGNIAAVAVLQLGGGGGGGPILTGVSGALVCGAAMLRCHRALALSAVAA